MGNPFKEARKYARTLNIKTQSEWFRYGKSGKLPLDVPRHPNKVYKDKGWQGIGDWLGTGAVAPQKRKFKDDLVLFFFVVVAIVEKQIGIDAFPCLRQQEI